MKKLIVLMLVLGLANAASAEPILTYTPIGTVSGTNDDIEAVAGKRVTLYE